jgi:uncharacterized membrane protein
MDKTRPIGITLLSVWYVFSGIGSLLLLIPFFAKLLQSSPDAAAVLSAVGIPPFSIPFFASLVSVVIVAAGIDMWKGNKGGWYIGSFYCFYFILVAMNDIFEAIVAIQIFFMAIFVDPGEILGGMIFYVIKILIAFAIPIVIYAFYFTHEVKEYFKLTEVSNISMVFNHIGFSIVLAIIYSWLT